MSDEYKLTKLQQIVLKNIHDITMTSEQMLSTLNNPVTSQQDIQGHEDWSYAYGYYQVIRKITRNRPQSVGEVTQAIKRVLTDYSEYSKWDMFADSHLKHNLHIDEEKAIGILKRLHTDMRVPWNLYFDLLDNESLLYYSMGTVVSWRDYFWSKLKEIGK